MPFGMTASRVGVVEDDVGRLAAQFQRHALDGAGSGSSDLLACTGRAGEADHVDAGVLGDRCADHRAGARHEVEDTGGRPISCTISARMKAFSGATSDGLSTNVQPAASAPPSLQMIWCNG